MTATPVLPRLHVLLLRMAGWTPDDVVCRLRAQLAEGRLSEVARSIVDVVHRERVPVHPDDAGLLAAVLSGAPEIALLGGAVPASGGVRPAHAFTAGPASPYDAIAVNALEQIDRPLGLWRSWRSTVPVYLLHTGAEPAALPGATDWLQGELARAGLAEPQVEVWAPGIALPDYQRLALDHATLLWAAEPEHPVTVARVFDGWDPVQGGRFDADHPVLSAGDELARVLRYLEQGRVLVSTPAREPDVFDPDAGGLIPMTFRTDGRWIWTDAVMHYLSMYALSPDPELLDHIRGREHTFTEPSEVATHRALRSLISVPS
ncbi:hypothetical protein [Actinoplanes sp. NBRC 101535]|uniref:hypothetical protein n=1 Tax=Actinoplanes sp. NBRC 101535 TaxID=3032196 RepID=UPI0024A0F0ED|nr:hypothetical protein [Actinoplanes sp. NBRC 101535]GLY00690.1 hypothetical protein Acsp01_10690 [Actinoplanes sp. NBRC 101535]